MVKIKLALSSLTTAFFLGVFVAALLTALTATPVSADPYDIIVWEYSTGLNGPRDAERLSNGNTLITDSGNSRVIEVDLDGTIVWEYSTGLGPYDAERLSNGNTLIADSGNARVIEVDLDGTIVWEHSEVSLLWDAERLSSGNTLISHFNHVIEVDVDGTTVWEYIASFPDVCWPFDAERLSNGHTLISDGYYAHTEVIEVDSDGNMVWEYDGGLPWDAERLSNSHTLITGSSGVIEVDLDGNIVWEYSTDLNGAFDAERLSNGHTLITDRESNRIIEVATVPLPSTLLFLTSGVLVLVGLGRRKRWVPFHRLEACATSLCYHNSVLAIGGP